MNSVLILWTYMITLAHSCSYLYNNTIFLTGTLQEVINVPLTSIFHYDNYERLTLEQNNQFLTIATPLQKYSETIFGNLKNAKTVSYKLKKNTISRDPINHLTILVVKDGIYYTGSNDGIYQILPDIQFLQALQTKNQSICQDIVFIEKLIVVECNDEQQNNYLLVMDSNKTIYLDVQNSTSQFIKLDQIDNYMFRATSNEIQAYIEEENNLKFINSLDQKTVKHLLNQDSIIIKDFQVHTNGQLSIMSDTDRIFIVELKNNSWILVKQIWLPLLLNLQGYDYNIDTNTYAAISKNKIIYKSGNMEEQIAEIQNQDSQYKIYLTQNNILLFYNKTVKLLNEKLTNIYDLQLDEEQYFINTNQNAQGFLIITDTKIAAYAINNYYFLQLSIDSPIEDEYQKASLIQEAYQGNCSITIFYKTEDFLCQKILQSQYSEGFIVGGINTDSSEIKINPIFQGPNIQYQIEANSLIEITILKYRLSYFEGISDSPTVGFHKLFQRYGESSFYLIQEDIDNQIKYYSCEGYLEITCQFLFEEGNSKQFQNISLWWSNNEDYIFWAIFQNNTVTIYYKYFSQPEYQILTTIILESDVKQILQIGQRLVILTELNIQIYEISLSEKAKLIITFDVVVEKIYMVENHPYYIFFEQDKSLYLYDIEYNLQTLVWYTTTTYSQYLESNLAIFENHFVRLLKSIDEDEYIVTVFNYENKRNIYLEKQISIIDYSDINLSDLLYSFKNNLFYIKGYSKQSSSYFVLVYKVTSNSLDTLFTKIQIKPNDRFSINGDFLYVGPKYYIITGDLHYKAKLQEDYTQISYTNQIQLDFEVTNDLQDKLAQSIFVNSINRGEKLIKLSNKINLKYHERNQTMICVNLGYDWYTGQTFEIDVSSDLENIEYKPSLKMEKEILEYSQQIQELNQNLLIQLMLNKVRIINKENFVLQEFVLDKHYQFTSILLIDGENIYVKVEQGDYIYLMIIQCKNYEDCKLFQYQLQVQSNIKKVFLHQNNFFIYVGNQVEIYDTKGNSTNLNQFQLIQIIPQYVQIKQMEFSHLKENVYQFISVDNWGNPEFQMIEINGTSTKHSYVRFMISSLIAEQKINLQEIQVSAGFVLRKNEITIIFKNSASYSFYYEMDCSINELCQLVKFEFSGLYQQYQGFQFCGFYSNENILLLTYFSNNFYRLFIYDMEIKSNNSKPNNAINNVWLSSIENISAFSFVYSFNGKLQLLTPEYNQSGNLLHYSLLRSHQLCINNTYYEDDVIFHLYNVGPISRIVPMKERVIIEGDIPPPPPPPPTPPTPPIPEDQGSFPIWPIIVIILGVLLIGGGLYMYYRQRGKREQDNNLLLAN